MQHWLVGRRPVARRFYIRKEWEYLYHSKPPPLTKVLYARNILAYYSNLDPTIWWAMKGRWTIILTSVRDEPSSHFMLEDRLLRAPTHLQCNSTIVDLGQEFIRKLSQWRSMWEDKWCLICNERLNQNGELFLGMWPEEAAECYLSSIKNEDVKREAKFTHINQRLGTESWLNTIQKCENFPVLIQAVLGFRYRQRK